MKEATRTGTVAMVRGVAQQIENFTKFPPRQKPAAFNLDVVLAPIEEAAGGGHH